MNGYKSAKSFCTKSPQWWSLTFRLNVCSLYYLKASTVDIAIGTVNAVTATVYRSGSTMMDAQIAPMTLFVLFLDLECCDYACLQRCGKSYNKNRTRIQR